MERTHELLENKPVRGPWHPALVHLPIALLPISVLLDLATWIIPGAGQPLAQSAFVCLLVGIASGLFAAVFGFIDYAGIRRDHPARKIATRHMILNIFAIGLFSASAALRYPTIDTARTGGLPLALAALALAALGYSGYLGGLLVYDDGIAVGRHRRRTRTPAATISVTGSAGSWVAVAPADGLRDGETLRVDLNGTIVAIARVAGALHAFQEFCTHRYGPLSEGAIDGCEVICPWHRSRFDVRTGRVTAGPAKIDLRKFGVEIRDGKIWLEAPPT